MQFTEENLTKFDQTQLYLTYERWPEYFKDATKIPCKLDHDPDFYKSIVLCGMGGSATNCDILKDLIQTVGILPCAVIKGQAMPHFVDKHSLVIVNSISGNTEESILMMKEASDRNAEVVSISSGGRLQEACVARGHKHIQIPNTGLPRASLPYLIMPTLRLINPLLEHSLDIPSILRNLLEVSKTISITAPEQFNISKRIAKFIDGGFVFCFLSPSLISVGTRFKNSLNENAKVHCLSESVLEASHNEIVPFTFSSNNNNNNPFPPRVLLVKWEYDRPIVHERFKKVKNFFSQLGEHLMEINAYSEANLINTIICSIYILDYSTIYLAILRNVDPSPTPAIDILKKI
jgi:glucose/mannose-6-phosphate isomerase